jgi:hypothetical protein
MKRWQQLTKAKITAGIVRTNLPETRLTKPTPATSLYYPIREKMEALMNTKAKSMTGIEFAARVVPKILKKNPQPVVYEGEMIGVTRFMLFLSYLIGPRWIDWATGFMSGLPDFKKMVLGRRAEERKQI